MRSLSVPESESELVGGIYRRESWTLRAAGKKGQTYRRKEGGEEGEFKQACLIDVSVFFPLRAVL